MVKFGTSVNTKKYPEATGKSKGGLNGWSHYFFVDTRLVLLRS